MSSHNICFHGEKGNCFCISAFQLKKALYLELWSSVCLCPEDLISHGTAQLYVLLGEIQTAPCKTDEIKYTQTKKYLP